MTAIPILQGARSGKSRGDHLIAHEMLTTASSSELILGPSYTRLRQRIFERGVALMACHTTFEEQATADNLIACVFSVALCGSLACDVFFYPPRSFSLLCGGHLRLFFLLFGCGPRVILDFTGVPFTAHETEVNKFELLRREICPFFMVQSKKLKRNFHVYPLHTLTFSRKNRKSECLQHNEPQERPPTHTHRICTKKGVKPCRRHLSSIESHDV